MKSLRTSEESSETSKSIVDETFKEIDEKLSIINKETKDWLKLKIMWHITEAYKRGKHSKEKS